MRGPRGLVTYPIAAIALAALAAVPLVGCSQSRSRPSILLITVDTLRADALGAYGARPSPTPRLDRLAAESTLFERAAVPMPLTRPSHSSILTSRYPREHGVLNNRMSLPDSERTLTEILAGHDYRTAGFVGVSLLRRGSGFEQGFETLEGPRRRQRPAEEVVRQALAWVDSLHPEQRFFLWVHLFDPHEPYAPPPEHRPELDRELDRRLPAVGWEEIERTASENDGDVPRAVLEHAKALYRGEVAATDHWIGELLDGLETRSRGRDETVVVVTADHGECFEDGVYFEHAHCLRDAALRVPLLVRHPSEFPPGARVGSQVSSLDIAPTLLAAAGLEPPADWSGRPLRAFDVGEPRYVLIQYPFYQQRAVRSWLARRRQKVKTVAGDPIAPLLIATEQVGLVGADGTYLRTRGPEGASEEFHPSPDGRGAGLEEDQHGAEERQRLAALLDEALRQHPLHLVEEEKVNAEMLETLRALGYVE